MQIRTVEGSVRVEKLEFPEDFPPGKYILRVTDKNDERLGPVLPTVECEFNITSPAAVNAAADKKKQPPPKKK